MEINTLDSTSKDDLSKISISILTYNRQAILRELLNSLKDLTLYSVEIIVVDNDSQDGTGEMMRVDFPQVKYIKMDENIGVEARNIGLKSASRDIVVTLDDDVFGLTDNDIINICKIFNNNSDIGAVCFKVLNFWTGEICNWLHHYVMEEYSDKQFITDEISEGAVAFRRSVFEKSGYYPRHFFISYEGTDLACRILDAGYKTIYTPEIVVRHKHAIQGRTSWRRYYFDTRNQILFVARNLPILMAINYLIRGLSAMLLYSVRDGFFMYWLKGIKDGLLSLPLAIKERKCINYKSIKVLREIASHRPGAIYMLKKRLFQKGIRI